MPESSERLDRITKVSRGIATACGLLFLLLPVFLAVISLGFPHFLLLQSAARQFNLQVDDLSVLTKLAAYGAMMVQSLPMLFALWVLRKLFQGYATGRVFTVEAAKRLKQAAFALLSMVVMTPVGGALFSLALSIATPPGQNKLVLGIGSPQVWIGLAGAMVLVTAWIMGEAAALAEENKSFV